MKTIRLTESDLRRIVIRTLKEQEQTPEPVSADNKVGNAIAAEKGKVGNALKLTKLNNGVEISEEYLEEYKKVKLEISGKTNEVLNSLRKLKYKGAVEVEPGITVEKKGTITFKGTEWVLPKDFDYTSL
jgi:hypothetical protein